MCECVCGGGLSVCVCVLGVGLEKTGGATVNAVAKSQTQLSKHAQLAEIICGVLVSATWGLGDTVGNKWHTTAE